MFKKTKRVLWLLNHRTLMKYEVQLLQRLGFEVFVPKVIPATGFRSGAVDFGFDRTLSISSEHLRILNEFDFYTQPWPPQIVAIVNRYFDTAFAMPYATLMKETINNFEGTLIFRAFGLQAPWTYEALLEALHGPLYIRKLAGIRERFWFGEGYDNLHEVEPASLADRALFLPIGMPQEYFEQASKWVGGENKILLLCPDIEGSDYYREVYEKFKQNFGDLPHLIIGAQATPVDDPSVVGFVTDERMNELFATCAALYYPSDEPRHVHYSPIEAAIAGLPVVFHAGSLLDRMSGGSMLGRVESSEMARALLERILAGDVALIERIAAEQSRLPYLFSDAHCAEIWREELSKNKLLPNQRRQSIIATLAREAYRNVMMRVAHGRIRVNPHKRAVRPPKATLNAAEAKLEFGASLFDGIHFGDESLPAFVHYVLGIGPAENGARWSLKRKIVIVLKHNLSGDFRLFVRAFGFAGNIGRYTALRVGNVEQRLRLPTAADDARGSWFHFCLSRPANVIEIDVAEPTFVPEEKRTIGLGLREILAAKMVTATALEARERYGSSLLEGIDFSGSMPDFVEGIQGLGMPDATGRWSVADEVRIELKHCIRGTVRLLFRVVGYGRNAEVPVKITIDDKIATIRFPAIPSDDEIAVDMRIERAASAIQVSVPYPVMHPGDDRSIGLHFRTLRMIEIAPGSKA